MFFALTPKRRRSRPESGSVWALIIPAGIRHAIHDYFYKTRSSAAAEQLW